MSDELDAAIAALRAMTYGPKGDRTDYVATISTAHASALIRFIDAVKPFYDAHAITEAEIRFLRTIRDLATTALQELLHYEEYLANRYLSRPAPNGDQTE